MAPMASVDGRYVGPLDQSDAPEVVAAIREGRKVLPGRGLEDSDYRLPWESRQSSDVSRQDEGPPARPDPEPA
jgi:NADH-quinone oxidoreductase subunit E